MSRKWRVLLILSLLGLGLALVGIGMGFDRLAATSTNMPWGSNLATRAGKYYFAPTDVPGGVVDEDHLVPVTKERFERRMVLDSLAALSVTAGLVLLWLLGCAMPLKRLAEVNPHLVPKNPEYRWLLAIGIMAVFGLFAVGMATRVLLAPGLTGMGWQTRVCKTEEGYFSVHYRTGRHPDINIPISQEQYQNRLLYEGVGNLLWLIGGVGVACAGAVMCVLQLAGKLTF